MTYDQQIPPEEISSDDKLWALLAYIFTPIVPVIILFLEDKKDRPFIKAHNVQALAIGVVAWAINIILSFFLIGICTSFLTLAVFIYLGIKAYQGQVFEIPYVTAFVKNQGWA